MDTPAKKFIIVADDNKLLGKVLTNKLTVAGYDVQLVTNGEEALAAVAARKPDLLLLDLIMPIKDGFTTLKELRANPAASDTKVIVTSDLEQTEDMTKIKELGAIGYFNKDNLQEIVDKIPQFISGGTLPSIGSE
jgi:CheY-like chemotaxis protein